MLADGRLMRQSFFGFNRTPVEATNERTARSIGPDDPATPSLPGRLGLRVIHEPRINSNVVNLIFVHGLGGASIQTWTDPASNIFWPSLLYTDTNFLNLRIATFGYNADFKNVFAPGTALGIDDFAKQLLNYLDLHYNQPNYGYVRTPQYVH